MEFKNIVFMMALLSGIQSFCGDATLAVNVPEQQNQQQENAVSRTRKVFKALGIIWDGTKIIGASLLVSDFTYKYVIKGRRKTLAPIVATVLCVAALENAWASKSCFKAAFCAEKLANKTCEGEEKNEN